MFEVRSGQMMDKSNLNAIYDFSCSFISKPTCTGQGTKCGRKTDITFVIDRSGSIRGADYDQMRRFLTVVGEDLQVGVRDDEGALYGQAAMVTFSEEATIQITLRESDTPGAFADKVKSMPGPLVAGRTRTHLGIDLADKEVLKQSAGYRENEDDVAKIFAIITDGEQTQDSRSTYVGDAIKPIFNRDVTVFAIGVGLTGEKAKTQIRDMVNVPENAIFPDSYSALINDVHQFVRKFCPGICRFLLCKIYLMSALEKILEYHIQAHAFLHHWLDSTRNVNTM